MHTERLYLSTKPWWHECVALLTLAHDTGQRSSADSASAISPAAASRANSVTHFLQAFKIIAYNSYLISLWAWNLVSHSFPVISDKANQFYSRIYYLVSVLGKDDEKTKQLV